MKYRPEIDGLRALAVMSVILFHAGFVFFKGGFVGVDIFFVISGYLITNIIILDLKSKKFSIIDFYERRARRLTPVLFLIMAASIPLAWMLLPPFDLINFSKSLIVVPLFASNFFFLNDGGYFETAAELKPLLHTWSLAVEEQFYIFYPILMIFIWKLGNYLAVIIISLIVILSLIFAQIASSFVPVLNFFLLPTRAWELAIGALVAFYFARENFKLLNLQYRQFLSFVGFLLIIMSIFLYDKSMPFPSVYSLIPTIGTILILMYALPDTILGRVLSTKPLVFLGLMSYSLYLWHQPIFVFARFFFSTIDQFLILILLALILLLSILSYYYVELPFRDKKIFSRKFLLICFFTSLFFIFFGFASSKILSSYTLNIVERKSAIALSSASIIYSSNMDERQFIKFRIQVESLNPNAIAVGSSRIMQLGKHNYYGDILNLSVSGASIEDDIAITDMAIKKFNPSIIFLSADPWLLNSRSGQIRWKSLEVEYRSAVSKFSSEVINNDYFHVDIQESIVAKNIKNLYEATFRQNFIATSDIPELRDKIRRDGSRIYSIAYTKKSQNEIAGEFKSWINYAMNNFEFSNEYQDIFGSFIAALSKERKVILILPPYHPDLYELIRIHYPIYLEIESRYRNLALAHGAQIIGSYNPIRVGCTKEEFFDGIHPKDSCMGKLMNELMFLNLNKIKS